MTELSPDARDLIEQARKQGPGLLGPSAAERARLREKLAPTWGQAPAPRRTLAPARWKRYALSSAALIAGIGWLCWLLYWPPAAETNERAENPPLTAANTAPQPTASEPAAPSSSRVAAPERSAEAANGPQPAHAMLKRPVNGRERSRAPAQTSNGAAQTDAREQAGASQQTGAASRADASQQTSERANTPSQTDGAQQTATAAQAQHAAHTEPHPGEDASLTAAAADSSNRAVRTDSRPGPRSIDGELELLGEAQTALQLQRPSRALNLLQEHAFRFPAGALAEERMAMQALALCALDRKNAAASVLSRLAARGSRSALLPRVRRQCGL